MMRRILQAKTESVKWAQQIPFSAGGAGSEFEDDVAHEGGADESAGEGAGVEPKAEHPKAAQFLYGWDPKRSKARRVDAFDGRVEFASKAAQAKSALFGTLEETVDIVVGMATGLADGKLETDQAKQAINIKESEHAKAAPQREKEAQEAKGGQKATEDEQQATTGQHKATPKVEKRQTAGERQTPKQVKTLEEPFRASKKKTGDSDVVPAVAKAAKSSTGSEPDNFFDDAGDLHLPPWI
ncbi:unnamed protein product [Prorocentrum cordatum]|uniref:Uncharacterized protein n=1 Tax=Prorocentrum cordatum TaxID=2364126 RepID=A0ABN9PYK8_9DINO|nr:unnamed protein product [Polarella glacialis]